MITESFFDGCPVGAAVGGYLEPKILIGIVHTVRIVPEIDLDLIVAAHGQVIGIGRGGRGSTIVLYVDGVVTLMGVCTTGVEGTVSSAIVPVAPAGLEVITDDNRPLRSRICCRAKIG
jgi:hypothetical protein